MEESSSKCIGKKERRKESRESTGCWSKGKKNVKEEDIPRGPGGKPIRIKDKIRAAKGQITHSEGKTFDAWKKAAASALGRKKEERKPQKAQDAGARAKRLLQRKEYASKVSGSTENVPDEMRD